MRRFLAICVVVCSAVIGIADTANAQVLERHAPPVLTPPRAGLAPTPDAPAVQSDDQSIGVTLRRLVVIADDAPLVVPAGGEAVSLSQVPLIDHTRLRHQLAAYIGRPLSRQRLATITRLMISALRRQGYPLASATVPEQDISDGTVMVRLYSFRLGKLQIRASSTAAQQHVAKALRQQVGQRINIRQLSEDVDALNAYPFRYVSGSFAAGAKLGTTDLTVEETRLRPYRFYAGYADAGTYSGTADRYFIGAQLGGWPDRDANFSYQLTASPDFFVHHGDIFGVAAPDYIGHSLRAYLPLAPRHGVEMTLGVISTNRSINAYFSQQQRTVESSIGYRGALSDFSPFWGIFSLGVEARQQRRLTFFDNVAILHSHADVYQFYSGWSATLPDRLGQSSINLTLHYSPGGITGVNSDAALTDFANGTAIRSNYGYGQLQLIRQNRLPKGWHSTHQLTAQWANSPLPSTEVGNLGGSDAVRGYRLDDGVFDKIVVLRNDLAPPAWRGGSGVFAMTLAPYAFIDAAMGKNVGRAITSHAVSWGAGINASLAKRWSIGATVACAAASFGQTPNGHCRGDFKAQWVY